MSGPVPLSEGGASITLDDTNDVSPRLGKSLPVLIAVNKNHTYDTKCVNGLGT